MRKFRIRLGALVVLVPLTLLSAETVAAEELSVPVGSQADRDQASFPGSGMSQSSVKSAWGTPREVEGPVGQPPITQWHYQSFVVFFEGDRVIHTVLKQD